jgi:hypothetical protein
MEIVLGDFLPEITGNKHLPPQCLQKCIGFFEKSNEKDQAGLMAAPTSKYHSRKNLWVMFC